MPSSANSFNLEPREKEIIELLRTDPDTAVSQMYDAYFQYLAGVVFRILQDPEDTQDIIQSVFIDVWRKHEHLRISSSLKMYLRRAAINKSLNKIRSYAPISDEPELIDQWSEASEFDHSFHMEASEMEDVISEAILELPERCRLVFLLSRFEDLTYRQIAEKLDISVKTVENQMNKALKLMRLKIYEKNK